MRFWDKEKLDLLERLWANGDSGECIAAQIPGATRNAVLSACRRYALLMRCPAKSYKVPRPRKNIKVA